MTLTFRSRTTLQRLRLRAHWLIWICAFLWALITPGLSYRYIEASDASRPHAEHILISSISAHANEKLAASPEPPGTVPATGPSGGNGIGGTGNKPKTGDGEGEGNGIGGTGQRTVAQDPNGNGIGGTGIIGAITGFGSIFVNGYEIDIPKDLPIHVKDGQTTADQLKIGQVVVVEARGKDKKSKKDKHVSAVNIRIRHEVGGKIEKINRRQRTIRVLGQTVKISRKRKGKTATHGLSFKKLRVGRRVEVSGFRRTDGTIEATRIDRLAKGEPDYLIGRIDKRSDHRLTVSGVTVTTGKSINTSDLAPGAQVRIVGTSRKGRFRARAVHRRDVSPFSSSVRHLAIEGFASLASDGEYLLGGFYPLSNLSRSKLGRRMIFNGRLENGHRFVPLGIIAPRLLKRRGITRHLLRQGIKGAVPLGIRSQGLKRNPVLRKKKFKRKHKRRLPRGF